MVEKERKREDVGDEGWGPYASGRGESQTSKNHFNLF